MSGTTGPNRKATDAALVEHDLVEDSPASGRRCVRRSRRVHARAVRRVRDGNDADASFCKRCGRGWRGGGRVVPGEACSRSRWPSRSRSVSVAMLSVAAVGAQMPDPQPDVRHSAAGRRRAARHGHRPRDPRRVNNPVAGHGRARRPGTRRRGMTNEAGRARVRGLPAGPASRR